MGGRLLRRWLEEPLLDVGPHHAAPRGGRGAGRDVIRRGDVRDLLRGMGDMERLVSRAAAGLANARDLVALKIALLRLPDLADARSAGAQLRERLNELAHRLACPPDVAAAHRRRPSRTIRLPDCARAA